jgi:hypothetical protein
MGHYAFLGPSNIVTEVITGKDEHEPGPDGEVRDWEVWYGNFRGQVCKRTSYNTRGGVHAFGGTPYRKNYAGLGYIYDEQRDAFIPPRPFSSWVLNEDTCLWDAPVPYPQDGKMYQWSEDDQLWLAVEA